MGISFMSMPFMSSIFCCASTPDTGRIDARTTPARAAFFMRISNLVRAKSLDATICEESDRRSASRQFQSVSSSLIGLVNAYAAITVDEEDVIVIALLSVSRVVHSRRPAGHAGHRQTNSGWALLQEATNLARRHMTFDRVATHFSRVAGGVLDRHAQSRPGFSVAAVIDLDLEAIGLQVLDPILATAA